MIATSLSRKSHSRGSVLILVLACLLIITVLAVAFLQAAGNERRSSSVYQATAETQQLGDTVVNLVEGQITAATESGAGNSWASQPGAIWTFTNGGAVNQIYRLYSWNALTAANGSTLLGSDGTGGDVLQLNNFNSLPSGWVDLNAPAPSTEGGGLTYPIVDPSLQVDGFGITNTQTVPATSYNTTLTAPMPVQWLYVLKDGSIIPPDYPLSTPLTFQTSTDKPSAANPIVGRIAYWTDDDTCKVNINTAGGDYSTFNSNPGPPSVSQGSDNTYAVTDNYDTTANASFWDVPRFNAVDEVNNNALYQPINGEFQRYPGHPATVGLASILSSLFGSSVNGPSLYTLTPRYTYGGSAGAEVNTIAMQSGNSQTTALAIPLKADRLYSSVEEMLFGSTARTPRLAANVKQVEQAKFFLTANSRAPELNLFGMPRISMWPIASQTVANLTPANPVPVSPNLAAPIGTPLDQVLALDSTLITGNSVSPYYFIRQDQNGSTGPSGSSSPTVDAALSRNTVLLNYLDQLTQTAIPGFGGQFGGGAGKYGTNGMRQVLTEMFDYIRTINSEDPNLTNGTQADQRYYAAGTPSSGNVTGPGNSMGIGQITPSLNPLGWKSMGLATFPILQEADIQFVGMAQGAVGIASVPASYVPAIPYSAYQTGTSDEAAYPASWDTVGDPSLHTPQKVVAGAAPYKAVQAFLHLNFVVPAQYMPVTENDPCFVVEVAGLTQWVIGPNQEALFPTLAGDCYSAGAVKYGFLGRNNSMVGYFDSRALTWSKPLTPQGRAGGGLYGSSVAAFKYNPFYSNIISLPTSALTMKVTNPSAAAGTNGGMTLTIKLYPPASLNYAQGAGPILTTTPLQTYTLNFNGGNFPFPTVTAGTTLGALTNPTYNTTDRFLAAGPGNYSLAEEDQEIQAGDVVEGVVLSTQSNWGGDTRMLATNIVPSAAFLPHPYYGSNTAPMAYGANTPGEPIWGGLQSTTAPATAGFLVPGAQAFTSGTPANSTFPLVPPGLNGATYYNGTPSWDWDNGVGSFPDGPYINKADEGSSDYETGIAYVPYFTWNKPNGNLAGSFFSPNRQIPSPGMFGSLPTGIDPTGGGNGKPWQTLLFRADSSHPSHIAGSPEDELLLDLFWMPVTDPYPISEAFSTAGKINLNSEIVPFTYIIRNTAVRAALSSEKIARMFKANASTYKQAGGTGFGGLGNTNFARLSMNLGANTGVDGGTLQQFRDLFTGGGNFSLSTPGQPLIFRSAAQICDIYLVPKGYHWASSGAAQTASYGTDFSMVGDNVRERPYTDIYGRITTKSNTYTVYYTVQSLKNPAYADQTMWSETTGRVVGQYRGSTSIERYLDPTNSSTVLGPMPDYATAGTPTGQDNMENRYRWRVVQSHQFIP